MVLLIFNVNWTIGIIYRIDFANTIFLEEELDQPELDLNPFYAI